MERVTKLAEGTILSDDFLHQLTAVGEVDLLVGIPTFNNKDTIQHAVQAIQIGLVKYFPRQRAVVINPDAGSQDGTPEIVRNCSITDFRSVLAANPLRTSHTITTSYHPVRGSGEATRLVLAAADLLRAKACAIVSPDLVSMAPEWMDGLLRPVYREGFDYVAPIYARHKFDGLLIKNLLSPLIGAAYGCELHEPAGGEIGFSGVLACHFLAQDVWHQDFMRDGWVVWMTTTALAGGYRVGQSFLGPKMVTQQQSSGSLADTLQRFVGALFSSLEAYQSFWISQSGSKPAPILGFQSDLDLGPVRVNRKRLCEMFRSGVGEISSILERILSASTLQEIQQAAQSADSRCHYSDELWVKTVYEFAASYHHSVISRDHILQALTPVYRGRIGSYLLENHSSDAAEVRARLEGLRQQYERLKPYLVAAWQKTQG
jgi:glucosylglycerate synthase